MAIPHNNIVPSQQSVLALELDMGSMAIQPISPKRLPPGKGIPLNSQPPHGPV